MSPPDQPPSSSATATTLINGDIEASSSSSVNRDSNSVPASSSSSTTYYTRGEGDGGGVEEEDNDRDQGLYDYDLRHPENIIEESQQQQQFFGILYRGNFFAFDESRVIGDDTWSFIIVVLTFWFFVSMTLILGVYGAVSVSLGPNSSVLIEPNPILVQSIKVEESDDTPNPGLVLYGLSESPSLDVVKTWSGSHNASVPPDSYKEWIYFLNEGSQINISYGVSSVGSSAFLVIAEGNEGLDQWLEDPTYPNTTLSWNVIHGSGIIEQYIYESSSYHVAVGNLNSDDVEVKLDFSVRSVLYDTRKADHKCSLADGSCGLSILFPSGNSLVLTTPGLEEVSSSEEWDVKVSYGPRWTAYIVGIVGMTVITLAAFNILNKFRCYREEEETGVQYRGVGPERAPLLQYKDDDLSSWGSSYDSASSDEKNLEEFLAANSIEGKPSRDGENGNNTRRLCAICYDAPRDCFFLPCGHCVACFECGTRIAEAAGTCPVCRRNMKKVRKIFTV